MGNLEIDYKFELVNNLFYKIPEETDANSLIKKIEKKGMKVDKERSRLNLLIEGYNDNLQIDAELKKYFQEPQGKIKGYHLMLTSDQLEGELELTINTYRKLENTKARASSSRIGMSMSDLKRTQGITGEIKFKAKVLQENAVKVIEELYETIESYFSNLNEVHKQLNESTKKTKSLFD
ncbi:MAG TPA: hypothetical protein ENF94_00140 [Candidatus Woesearchaeota archaeon]|nr:hypothetical protein [Candidatus Woesearchaeota archaeon]